MRALRRAPGPAAAPSLPFAERLHPPARQDQLRRGGAPAPGLRDPHGVRFAEHDGRPAFHLGTVEREGGEPATLARLTYGQAATLWRINLGWMRRKNKDHYGFVLDTERGYWAKNEQIRR